MDDVAKLRSDFQVFGNSLIPQLQRMSNRLSIIEENIDVLCQLAKLMADAIPVEQKKNWDVLSFSLNESTGLGEDLNKDLKEVIRAVPVPDWIKKARAAAEEKHRL